MFFNKINPQKIKAKNTQLLHRQGIEVIDHLPYLDLNQFRDSKQVAKRCVAMAALLQLHFEAPNEFIKQYLIENDLMNELTDQELKRLEVDHEAWDEQDQIDLYWMIEAIWALMWVGKKHNNLTFDTGVEDSLATFLPKFHENESADQFISNFKMRTDKELFTQLDLFYRAHWFARNLSLAGKKSPLVNLDYIMERRKALEWVCDDEVNWDEVSLST